jgi:hypothetical protein
MSSNSSSIDADDLDVDEGAVVQSAQPSIFEFVNPSTISEIAPIISESPEPFQKTSKSLYKASQVPEKKKRVEVSADDSLRAENPSQSPNSVTAQDRKNPLNDKTPEKETSLIKEITPPLSPSHQDIPHDQSSIHTQSYAASQNYPNEKSIKNKNFIKRNIEITKNFKNNLNIESINIDDFCLEPEDKKEELDVDKRFYQYKNKVEAKIQNLAKELKDKQMQNCTFKPDVKNENRRTTSQFLNEMKEYEKAKKDKIDALKLQKKDLTEDEALHRPVINQKSKEIVSKKNEPNEPVFEKLYKSAKPAEKSPLKSTLSKSSSVKRTEPLENALYEDALRRAAKVIEPKSLLKDVQVNIKSQQVLSTKFTKEFYEVLSTLAIDTDSIDKQSGIKVINCLNFIRNNPEHPKHQEEKVLIEKFFKIIDTEDVVIVGNLLRLSLAVVNIYTPSMTVSIENHDLLQYGTMHDKVFSVTKDDVLKIHKLFMSFYENRQLSNQIIKQVQPEEYSFKPQINTTSQFLAKDVLKRSNSLRFQKKEEFEQQEKKKTQEKLEKIKKDKEDQELKSCTFKPSILKKSSSKTDLTQEHHRTLSLYQKSKETKEKKEKLVKTIMDQEIEKNMSECTFAPKLEKIKVKEDKEILYTKSVQQQIFRMQKAREEQERKKKMIERNFSERTLSFAIDSSHKSKSSFKPPVYRYQQKNQAESDSPVDLIFENEVPGTFHNQFDKKSEINEKFGVIFNENFENPNLNNFTENPNQNYKKKEEISEEEEIQLEVKMPDGSQKTLFIPPGSDKELKISMFILENKLSQELGQKLRKSILN